jgi:flavin-binding protein dodecin
LPSATNGSAPCVEAGRVQLNELRRRIAEQAAGRGGEVGEPRADRDNQIRFSSKRIGRRAAGDADRTHGVGMVPNERTLAGLGLGDRHAMTRHEIGEHLAGQRVMHPAAGNDQRRAGLMPDHVYRIIQVAGSSQKSIEDAIQNAVGRASSTLRQVGWFEVVETRGHVEDGRVAHYQVTLKIGFTLDDDD